MNGTADEWYQIRTLQEWGEWCYLASEETKKEVTDYWWQDHDEVPPQFEIILEADTNWGLYQLHKTPAGEYILYYDGQYHVNDVERAVSAFMADRVYEIAEYILKEKGVEATINWLRQFNDKTR